MLAARYGDKYGGYGDFVSFWERVDGAGSRGCSVIGSASARQSLRCRVWYGRRGEGTVSNEVIEVDLVLVGGSILIDDYRFLRVE